METPLAQREQVTSRRPLARRVDAVILWPTPASRTLYDRHGFAVRDDLFGAASKAPLKST